MPKRSSSSPESAPKAPGAFLVTGSYSERAEMHHRGHVDALVRSLVAQRRRGELSLELAARAILGANAEVAFPNFRQWALCEHWALAWTSTAAEEAVKREGRGTEAHWCGQRWSPQAESACPDPRHRSVAAPKETIEAIGRMESHLTDHRTKLLALGLAPGLANDRGTTATEDVPPPMT